ncbi:MAG: acyltransferase [Xanthomonadales bacterium]|nr:acyltransferase [Xanthomonadales bacterium]
MRSSNIKYLPEIDHLRAYAALLIIVYHGLHLFGWEFRFGTPFNFSEWPLTSNPIQAILLEGHTAVTFFMVLSGFIFTLGCYHHKISYSGFIRNRLLRTYPLFLFMLVAGIIFYPEQFNIPGLLKTIFFLGNYPGALVLGSFSAMFWAIAIEWQFYLLFPLLLWLLNRYGITVLLVLIALMILIRLGLLIQGHDLQLLAYMTIWGRLDQFLIGMLVAVFYKTRFQPSPGWDRTLLLSIVLLAGSLTIYNQLGGWISHGGWKFIWPTWEGLIWGLLIISYCSAARHIPGLFSKAMVSIGTISYSIYLIHYLVINELISRQWLLHITPAPMWNALANTILIALPITLLISAITYRWIEKPFLSRRGKYRSQ